MTYSFIQYTTDGINWYYPYTLINPLQLNTWYVASLKISPTGVAMIEVWQKDNPSVRGSYTLQMPAGRSYCFHNWILTGNVWLDNYQEMDLQATTYVYDGDGNRVEKVDNGQTTVFINQYYEKNITTGTATSYYYLGSKLIAQDQGGTLSYIYQDSLNSTTVTSDSSGNLQSSASYLPFGGIFASSGTMPTDKLFTGQRLDSIGLYYYGARYYDPGIGRFISPDTIVPDPADPQNLNRYTYALNNPLKYTDPSGHIVDIMGVNVSLFNSYGFDAVMAEMGATGQYYSDYASLFSAYNVVKTYDPVKIYGLESSNEKVVNIDTGSVNNANVGGQTLPTNITNAVKDVISGNGNNIDWTITIPHSEMNDTHLAALVGHELYHANDPFLSDSIQEEVNAYQYQDRIADFQDILRGQFTKPNNYQGFRALNPNNEQDLQRAQNILTGKGQPPFYQTLPLFSATNRVQDFIYSVHEAYYSIW